MPGTFVLNMTGRPLKTGAVDILLGILKSRFEKFSPDHEVNIIHFGRISFRIEVSGTPEKFDYLDNMMKSVKLYIERYLSNWEYDITVKYTESG